MGLCGMLKIMPTSHKQTLIEMPDQLGHKLCFNYALSPICIAGSQAGVGK